VDGGRELVESTAAAAVRRGRGPDESFKEDT
jgi:hypothetical protein